MFAVIPARVVTFVASDLVKKGAKRAAQIAGECLFGYIVNKGIEELDRRQKRRRR